MIDRRTIINYKNDSFKYKDKWFQGKRRRLVINEQKSDLQNKNY